MIAKKKSQVKNAYSYCNFKLGRTREKLVNHEPKANDLQAFHKQWSEQMATCFFVHDQIAYYHQGHRIS